MDSEGVGAGNDHKVWVTPSRERRPDLLHVLLQGHHLLACKEAALFGEDLVLKMAPRHARGFILPDGARHIDRVAVTRIGVTEDGDIDSAGNVARVLGHLRLRDQSHVRVAALGCSPKARHIHHVKPHRLRNSGMGGVQHKGCHHHRATAEHRPEPGGRRRLGAVTLDPEVFQSHTLFLLSHTSVVMAGRGPCFTQHLRETLDIFECVHLGDQRGKALSPLPPEHRIDQQVEFVGDFVERHRVFR